jgi:hypothetical protein
MNWLTVVVPGVLLPVVGIITGYASTRIAARDVHRRIKADLELHQLLPDGFDLSREALHASIDRQVIAHSKPYQGLTNRQRSKLKIALSVSLGLLLASASLMFLLRSAENVPTYMRITLDVTFYVSYAVIAAITFTFMYKRMIYGPGRPPAETAASENQNDSAGDDTASGSPPLA